MSSTSDKQAPFSATYREAGDQTAIVELSGRLMLGPEGTQLERVVKALLANGVRKFVFDFQHLSHVDSTGIGRCISALNMIMQVGGKLRIAAASGQVREGFRVTQLDKVFQFTDTVELALASL